MDINNWDYTGDTAVTDKVRDPAHPLFLSFRLFCHTTSSIHIENYREVCPPRLPAQQQSMYTNDMFIHVYLQYIRLTPDRQSKRGQLWNTVPWSPRYATDSRAPFELHTRFEVSGQGKKLFGDGMAVCKAHFKNGNICSFLPNYERCRYIFFLFFFLFTKGARSVPRMNHRVC